MFAYGKILLKVCICCNVTHFLNQRCLIENVQYLYDIELLQ